MSVNVGTFSIGDIYVGSNKIAEAYVGSNLVYQAMRLPVKTFRFKFSDTSFNPSTTLASSIISWSVVDSSRGIWDATSTQTGDTPYRSLFSTLLSSTNMSSVTCAIIGANTTGMTSAYELFRGCDALSSVCKMDFSSCTEIRYAFYGCNGLTALPLFDFHNVTNAGNAFQSCTGLTSIPNFDFSSLAQANFMFNGCSNITDFPDWQLDNLAAANYMFSDCLSLQRIPNFGQLTNITGVAAMFNHCWRVASGILAIYNILSVRVTTAANYRYCFRDCGRDSGTGSAELAQIPSAWK